MQIYQVSVKFRSVAVTGRVVWEAGSELEISVGCKLGEALGIHTCRRREESRKELREKSGSVMLSEQSLSWPRGEPGSWWLFRVVLSLGKGTGLLSFQGGWSVNVGCPREVCDRDKCKFL